jgi:hypothetical protein
MANLTRKELHTVVPNEILKQLSESDEAIFTLESKQVQDGEGVLAGQLWLHILLQKTWSPVNYKSEAFGYVTDAKENGVLVPGGLVRIRYAHRSCGYPVEDVTKPGTGEVYAFFEVSGIGICNSGLDGVTTATYPGYEPWSNSASLD